MTRTRIILFSFLLLCLQAQAQAYSLPFLSNPPVQTPTINAYSGTPGEVDIRKDTYGFYVEADFVYNDVYGSQPTPKPNPLPSDTVKMMISLSNSETIAPSSCLNFTSYNNVRYNWDRSMWESPIFYPNFRATSRSGHGFIYLDRKYWAITKSTLFLTSANACETKANTSLIGLDRNGVIGLGTYESERNFLISKNFSVYIKPDLSSGKLIFTNDTNNYTVSSEPVYKLSADVNWWLSIENGSLEIKNSSTALESRNAIFDVNSDAIGLPSDLFTWFINNFGLIPGISCGSDLYMPSCNTTGNVQDLPDITLSIENTQVKIPPKIYATPTGKSSFKLNLKATSPDLSGPSYVTTLFKDSIILDAHFMSYYFTVFDGTKDSYMVSLYSTFVEKGSDPAPIPTPHPNPDPTPAPAATQWRIIGAGILVFVVVIGFCVKRKIAANKLIANIEREDSLSSSYTSYN